MTLLIIHGSVRGLLPRVLPLARGLAGVLVSAPPVLLLAGLGAIGHDLAAGAVAEGLALFGAAPAGSTWVRHRTSRANSAMLGAE